MAYLVGFQIKGLAGVDNAYEMTLDRHLNVFFGPNGCGKTSLLKILHSALANDASTLKRTPFTAAVVWTYSLDADSTIKRTLEPKILAPESAPLKEAAGGGSLRQYLEISGAPAEDGPSWITAIPASSRLKAVGRIAHTYLPTSRLYTGARALQPWEAFGQPPLLEENYLDDAFARLLSDQWRSYAASILSQTQEAQALGLTRILQTFLSVDLGSPVDSKSDTELAGSFARLRSFLARQGSPELLGDLDRFKGRYRSDGRLHQVVNDIDEVERAIGEARAPRDRFQQAVQQLFTGDKRLVFEDLGISIRSARGAEIALANLSSGEKHLLRILVDVLAAGEGTVLIDEPEISMHIDWQAKFVEIARALNPHCQLILATHSPEVCAQVPKTNLFRMP